MHDTKTPTKRKSMGGSNFTPGSNKKVKVEPGSANKGNMQATPKSPFNKIKTLNATPQINGTPKSGKKGKNKQVGKSPDQQEKTPKLSSPTPNTNGSPFQNKGKVPMFAGTGTVQAATTTPIIQAKPQSSPDNLKKENKELAASTTTQVLPNSESVPGDLNRSQRKRLRTKLRKRKNIVEKAAELLDATKKDPEGLEKIKVKIAEIKSRKVVSNTAKRKLAQLVKIQHCIVTGELPTVKKPLEVSNTVKRKARRGKKKSQENEQQNAENKLWNDDSKKAQKIDVKKNKKNAEKIVSATNNKVSENKTEGKVNKQKKPILKKQITPVLPLVSKDAEESSDEESEELGEDYNAESIIKVDKVTKRMNNINDSDEEDEADSSEDELDTEFGAEVASGEEESDSDEENLEGDSDEESDDDAESGEDESEIEEETKPEQKKKMSKMEKKQHQELKLTKTKELVEDMMATGNADGKGKSRYVLFVGNLPYDVTTDEIKEHFEKKVPVKNIRLPTEKGTNKPRGFGYVEVSNEDEYQRALSLHNTFLKQRRINVLYTKSGSKKGDDRKDEIKVKNMKLSAMRQKGMLAGSVKDSQRRAARRNKRKGLQQKAGDKAE